MRHSETLRIELPPGCSRVTPLKVYIAASSREVERVRAAQQAVADNGWTLTLDWLTPILDNLAAGRRDMDLSAQEAYEHADADCAAIRSAEVLWFLSPLEPTKGAWWELGYGDAHGLLLVASGPASSIFERRVHVRCERDALVVGVLKGVAAAQSQRVREILRAFR